MTDLYSLLPIVLLLVIFYLLVMRPARARQNSCCSSRWSWRSTACSSAST